MRIEHIAIWVKDLELMKKFYKKYFDAKSNEKYVNSTKGYASYFLSFSEGARLELMQKKSIPVCQHDPVEQHTGLIHFALSLGSRVNVDCLTDRLEADGYTVVDGPRPTGDGYYESVVLDPEGNRIELTV
jgi:lactoylglutathione lyase